MVDTLFCAPKLKIERANEHINNLDARIREFSAGNPYPTDIQDDPKTGQRLLKPVVRESIPKIFAAIVGDAIHNLRAALDFLACDLVVLNGESTKNIYFPTGIDRNGYESAIQTKVKGASKNIIDIFETIVEPYPGGKHSGIRSLHDLDLSDKHVTLTAIAVLSSLNNIHMSDSNRNNFFIGAMRINPEKGASFMAFPANTNIKIDGDLDTSFQIVIGEGQPLQGEPVIPTLKQFSQLVSNIILIFENAVRTAP